VKCPSCGSRYSSRLPAGLAVLFLPLALLLGGCGISQIAASDSGTTPNAPTATLSASSSPVVAGASSVLSVTATNATKVTITGTDKSTYTIPNVGGTQTVTPMATTTYTATANGAAGTTPASSKATVTVVAATANPTVHITADPKSIASGASSVLTVTATNATKVVVTGSDTSSYTLQPTGGKQSVTPTTTTTYIATASGAAGTTAMTATVTVTIIAPVAAPTLTISASPATVLSGSSSVLTVVATNATQVTLTGAGNTSTLQPAGGTATVTPATTTIYTAIATGAVGTAPVTKTVEVTVAPSPTVSITASPTSVVSGSSSFLTVNATNAIQVTVTGGGTTTTLTPSGGLVTVTPSATTAYTATATGPAGTAPVTATTSVTVTQPIAPTVKFSSSETKIDTGQSSVLTVVATNSTRVTITNNLDNTTYTLPSAGGTQTVSPTATITYTVTATGTMGAPAVATLRVTVAPPGTIQSVTHVIFMLQENHSFDNYFGMLDPYKTANNDAVGADGITYLVDGIDDKLTKLSNQDDEKDAPFNPFKLKSTCLDDMTSAWLESYGDVNRYNFTSMRQIKMDGFVHTAEGFDKFCATSGTCSGPTADYTDPSGRRAMGFYDQNFLNYYYYMASNFALSDRWFSPVSSKSVPNRIATFTGGTTQGLVSDPAGDGLGQLDIPTIFRELKANNVSWKIYYTVSQGQCLDPADCNGLGSNAYYPGTNFSHLQDSYQYLYVPLTPGVCVAPTEPSQMAVGDPSNSFCIDPTHIAPLSQYFTDLQNGTLPNFSFIEAGYGNNDEHPGAGQSVLVGQKQAAKIVNALMTSPEWLKSVFFLAYDEGGGPYDHVPPVSGHSNDFTDPAGIGDPPTTATYPDISSIAVDADAPTGYRPCLPTPGAVNTHCDLGPSDPGAHPADAAAISGFPAQLGFRVPNMVISPFTRKHYVGHLPMDHTAILKFVEDVFIDTPTNSNPIHLTPRVAAQPNLTDFFDFVNAPWATPPTAIPIPYSDPPGTNSCTPATY
jgi:phospholipase C